MENNTSIRIFTIAQFFNNFSCDSFFKSPKKKYSKKTILDLKFKIPVHNSIMELAGNLNLKPRIVIWNNIFWRFGDLKNETNFLKRSHLY